MRRAQRNFVFACLGLLLLAGSAYAQQVTVGNRFHTVNDSFNERIGTSWGIQGKGWNLSVNGGGFANPQFGNPQPNAGMNGGFALVGGLGTAHFNFTAGQGSQRSMISQSPSVTMMNGTTGTFSDTSISPFVMGFIPVVGGAPMVGGFQPMMMPMMSTWENPGFVPPENHRVAAMRELMDKRQPVAGHRERPEAVAGALDAGLAPAKAMEPRRAVAAPVGVRDDGSNGAVSVGESSAGVSVPSVAEAKRLRAAEQKLEDPEIRAQFARGQAAEDDGKPKLAKVYYDLVARRATGELKQQALERLQQLRTAKEPPGAE